MAEKQVDRDAEVSGSSSAKKGKKPAGRRIQVRRSGVHGKGVFALQAIPEGETIIEYVGEIITWKQADKRGPSDPNDENHTFFFSIMDGQRVIDANVGGNAARWINHSCNPNCEADEDEDSNRVFIKALRNIKAGEELNYDYGLVIDEPYTKQLKAQYQCLCGAKDCRGTMLAPKRGGRK
jgi:SET domain-containing protein